jgi:predicted ATPase
MAARRPSVVTAPFLKRLALDPALVTDKTRYPFTLPFLTDDFEVRFTKPITIIAGENGAGKSTLMEAIAELAGFGGAGGSADHRASHRTDTGGVNGDALAPVLRAGWLPKMSKGWFFRAESFFTIAQYLDDVGSSAGFLEHSHGEGFLRVFRERCLRQGLYLFDEPESALSPARQVEFLKLLRQMEELKQCQVIMATHSPLLMAYPGADLLYLSREGLVPTALSDTGHFRLMQAFFENPAGFVADALTDQLTREAPSARSPDPKC